MLPLQIDNSGNSEGTMPGATMSPNLYFPILDTPQVIIISDACQHSTRMTFHFHYKHNCFIDYFNEPVPVIYAGNIPFWCNEQEGRYTEFCDNSRGNKFLVARTTNFLLSHRGAASHVSHTPVKSRKSNNDYTHISHSTPLPTCQCLLWIQMTQSMQPISQGKEMLKQNVEPN